eukprot:g25305.t1
MQTITLRRPDDWHLHLRDGAVLEGVIGDTSRHFARAIIMPNLVPPVVTTADAKAYRERIVAALPAGDRFEPLMTLYLTEHTSPDDVEQGKLSGLITAVKLYPAGATTNSHGGVRDMEKAMPVLERMAKIGLPLCVHGEVTNPEVDIFDREAVFLETVLDPLRRRLPELKITMEHVTTADGIDYIKAAAGNLAGSITTHHLIINRNDILVGGIRPHYYCLPVAKREKHRLALRAAAVSGDRRFFLGTDSAPHVDPLKECACGCAGIYTSINTMSCLAHVFEQEQALDRLEAFTSLNGPLWYGLAPNSETLTLAKQAEQVAFPAKRDTQAGAITVVCLMVTLFGTWCSRRTDSFLLTLVVSLAFVVAGIVAYSAYTARSGILIVMVAYTLLMGGFATIYAASVQFRTAEKPWRLAAGLTLAGASLGLPLLAAGLDGLGLIIMNVAAALLLLGTATQYWHARMEAPGPLAGMAALYAVSGISFAVCGAVLIGDGRMRLGHAPDNWAETLNIGICIAGMTGIGALSLALHQWRLAALHRQEAMTDALTGLLNRRALFEKFGGRELGADTAVIVFDIDRFKGINDRYGHSGGDSVLRLFAEDMLAETSAACVARLGGEEFAMIVNEVTPGRAERIANEVRKRFAARDIMVDGEIIRCTVSAGVSIGRPEGQPFETVLSLADSALYEAKRSGRDRVELASYLRPVFMPGSGTSG